MPSEDLNITMQDTSQIVVDDDDVSCGPVLISRLEVNNFFSIALT